MNSNIQSLIQACHSLDIRYEILHSDGNLVLVHAGNMPALFSNWTTPVNSQAVARLCEDKEYSYVALSKYMTMPRTIAFLDPQVAEQYQRYVRFNSTGAIVQEIADTFSYPFVLKRNRGSHGSNVFLVNDKQEAADKIETIFDKQSKEYDYVALVQEHITIAQEYRAVMFNGALMFAYLKSTSQAEYTGNLSPLHWSGAKAEQVSDPQMLSKIEQFAKPGLGKLGVRYAGIDIAEDADGQLWCIEINASPGFDKYIRDCGDTNVVALYIRILQWLSEQ